MTRIFIDSNIFLDFYRLKSIKPLLPSITNMAPHIITTEQVVNEVLRNRVEIAKTLLKEDLKQFKFQKPSLPDFLTKQAVEEISPEINKRLQKWEKEFKEINKEVSSIYQLSVNHVSEGDDEISKVLENIFSNPLCPSDDEIKRARLRKELGNPPGKKNDPIGDELSWEQLLTYRKNTNCQICIVSKDEDFYSVGISDEPVPNAYLVNETNDHIPRIIFFKDLPNALKHLKATNIISNITLPSDAVLDEVIKEQEKEESTDSCEHQVRIIENGRFDVYMCQKCGKQLGAYLADID